MNRICITCNIEIDESNYLKDESLCKSCYNKNRRKNHQPESGNKNKREYDDSVNNLKKLKIGNVNIKINVPKYENHRHVVIGPSNVGKT